MVCNTYIIQGFQIRGAYNGPVVWTVNTMIAGQILEPGRQTDAADTPSSLLRILGGSTNIYRRPNDRPYYTVILIIETPKEGPYFCGKPSLK